MEKSKKQKVSLGIFVVIATAILITALYFIGNRQHLFERNMMLKAQFFNVNGLQIGNNVRFAGIDVGTVSSITMTSDASIVVDMRIRKETTDFLRNNAVATIGSDGLVGNMIVNITPQKGMASAVQSGDTLQTYSKIATDDMLTTLSVTNENAALLTADLLKITSQILNGDGTIGMLINDPQIAQDLKSSVGDIRRFTSQIQATISEFKSFSQTLNTEGSIAHTLIRDTISGLKLKKIIEDVDRSSTSLVKTTASLEETMKGFENDNGTLNYLIKDTLLPKQIELTVQEIKESSERLNENMEALKSNFLFRGYFKRLERQARKDKRTLTNESDEN